MDNSKKAFFLVASFLLVGASNCAGKADRIAKKRDFVDGSTAPARRKRKGGLGEPANAQAQKPNLITEPDAPGTEKKDPEKLALALEQAEIDPDMSAAEGPVVLRDIDLSIKPGSRVGIVGPTGSGKSTLIQKLAYMIPPAKGEILIDGVDLSEISSVDYRKSIVYCPQKVGIFRWESLAYNIGYGSIDVDNITPENMEMIKLAARLACISDKIESFPDGYNTVLNKTGQNLSGGEEQRVGIARAFLKLITRDVVLFIADEFTSALDVAIEKIIMDNLYHLQAATGVISVTIAHRLSTLTQSDVIHFIENNGTGGTIIESGSHDELLAKKGLYCKYWLSMTDGENLSDAPVGRISASEIENALRKNGRIKA